MSIVDPLELFSALYCMSYRILCNTAEMWLQHMWHCLRSMLRRFCVRLNTLTLCSFVVWCLSLL